MRFKLTALLLLLNVALFSYILYLQSDSGTASLFEEQNRRLLDPDFTTSLDRIILSGPGLDVDWEFLRDPDAPGNWLLQQPLAWKANPFAVDQLLFQLARLRWESRFPVDSLQRSGQSLADYGLDEPRRILRLFRGDESLTLRIGNPTGIGQRFYFLNPSSESVMVAKRPLFDLLTGNPARFYAPGAFSLDLDQTRAIQIHDQLAGNVRVRLVSSNDQWHFVSPIEAPADSDRVKALLQQWLQFEVTDRRPLSEVPANFDGSTLRLTLEGPAGRQTLRFAPSTTDEQTFYAARAKWPTAFAVPANRLLQLRSAQADLREKRILRFLVDQWNSLQVSMDESSTTLQQLESGQWQVLFTDDTNQLQSVPADPQVVKRIHQFMEITEAVRFVTDVPSESDLTRFGLDDPQRRVLFRRPDLPAVEFLIGGVHPEETLLYATTSASDSVFLVQPHILSIFPPDPSHYRNRTLWEIPADQQLTGVALVHLPSGIDLIPEQTPEERQDLRAQLNPLRAQRFLPQPFARPLKLDQELSLPWKYLLELTTTAPQEAENSRSTRRFLLTEPLGSSLQYLGIPESARVVIPEPALVEALRPFVLRFPQTPTATPPAADQKSEAPESPPPAP